MTQSSKLYTISHNNQTVDVLITKKNIKSLRLKINNDGKVNLNIPSHYPFYKAVDFLNQKLDWIFNNLQFLSIKKSNECCFKNGAKISIWGQVYNVCIQLYKKDKIELTSDNLIIYTKNNNEDYIQKKFTSWAKNEFIKTATNIYNQEFHKNFDQYGLNKPKLNVRLMKSMWGNCKYNKGEITLNLYLIKTSLICLRYVIVHELTHLLFHDHGVKFKQFLTEVMPEWKQCKKELKNYTLNF